MRIPKTALQTTLQALLVLPLLSLGLGIATQAHAQTTVAGSTPGQFAVSPSGAATYRIPIQVPPGVAGMAPKLELVYNSQSGNGMLGVGWGLSGLSTITRCPRTKASDGAMGSVNFDANDRFCMDGQRLILTTGTVYGAPGTEYRTEMESFSKITANGTAGNGPASFTVKTKSGLTMEFGNTVDSAIEAIKAPGSAATWPATTIRVWAQNKVMDVKGNHYTVSYDEDAVNGAYYPKQIDYTGNAASSPVLVPSVSVRFVPTVAPRSDIENGYQAGALTKTTKRIGNVQAFNGAVLVKDYRLTFESPGFGGRSRVIAVEECEVTGNCFHKLNFGWTNGNNGTFGPFMPRSGDGANYTGVTRHLGDVNGDGKADLILIDQGSEYVYVRFGLGDGAFGPRIRSGDGEDYTAVNRVLHDVDGDGKVDVILWGRSENYAYVRLNLGDGTFGPRIRSGDGTNFSGVNRVFADVNADGRLDMLLIDPGNDYVYVRLGLGDGTFGPRLPRSGDGADFTGISRLLGDVDGDGKLDLIMPDLGNEYVYVRFGLGDGTFGPRTPRSGDGANYTGVDRSIGDVNGDGKADLILIDPGTEYVYVRLGLGDGTFGPRIRSGDAANFAGVDRAFSDVNGDGKVDLLLLDRGTEYVYVRLGFGDGTFGPLTRSGDGANYAGIQRLLGDVDGDGKTDLILADMGNEYVYVRLSTGVVPNMLVAVSSITGATTSIVHTTLTKASVYTKDSGANKSTYPKLDIQSPMYVVSSVASSNGVGGTNTTNYTYGGLKAEIGTGRGMLGFRWTKSTELSTGLESYTEYRQDFPYTGIPLMSETRLAGKGNAGVLKRNTNTVECKIPQNASACVVAPGNRYFPVLSSTTEASWDLNAAAFPVITTTTSYVADANGQLYGDVGTITVGTNDGAYKQTVNQYFPADTTNWILGRLKSATVTSVKP